jgi:nicotinamidase-related amidase
LIPESDLALYRKAGLGHRIGFGRIPGVLVVDATRSFVEDAFPLGNGRTGRPAIAAIRRLCDVARSQNIPIIFTRMEEPFKNRSEAGRWGDVAPGLLAEPGDTTALDGATIPDEIRPRSGELVITKPKPSAFFGTQLVSVLVFHHIDTLIVTGMVTSGCVRATVDDAFAYNFRVIVPIECVADRAEVPHQVNLFDMDMVSADVLPLEVVVRYLRGEKGRDGGGSRSRDFGRTLEAAPERPA